MSKCANCGTPTTVRIVVASGRGVAERWRAQYTRTGHWESTSTGPAEDIYNKLCALGADPNIGDVAAIIGNKGWSYLRCRGCSEYVTRAVGFSDYDDSDWLLCQHCLAAGLRAIET